MTIWANTIVHNEENFIWFAVSSVIDFVDKVLIYDSGSTDETVKIIDELKKKYGSKISFREVGEVTGKEFPKLRQQMLEESESDWILILDGDEIWWKDSIKKVASEIKKQRKEIKGIVVPMVVPVGDIYHIQEEKAGRYNLLGKKGHFSLRVMSRKIPGLHVDWPYGKESYFDENNNLIQERKDIIFLDAPYLHATHLKRSSRKRSSNKFKYELGKEAPDNFKFPEVLNESYPEIISSPWIKISGTSLIRAKLLTPIRRIKRRLINE